MLYLTTPAWGVDVKGVDDVSGKRRLHGDGFISWVSW
jgi:hypothetical protein